MNGGMTAPDTSLAALSVDTCIIGDDPGGHAVALALVAGGLSVFWCESRDPARRP